MTRSDIGLGMLLVSLSIAYSALTRRGERARRALQEGIQPTVCPNLLAAWGLASAVLLPLPLATAVLVIAAVAEWPARNISGQATPYRYVYSTASAVLGASVTRCCLALNLPRQLGFLTAAGAYTATSLVIIALAIAATGQFRALQVYTRIGSYRLDFLTALIALAQVELHELRFPLLWLSLPVTIALQRRTVKADLRSAAEDSTTKPMSQEAWLIAAGEIVAALPVVAVMRISTSAPLAVAEVAEMQAGCDAIGYVGDSGLAVLLVDCPDINADALAMRLRTALRYRNIEASVATAAKSRDGYSLADLLAVCEAELIARDAANRSAKPSRPDA
ncbi:MAG: hypothetical protein ACJ74U_18305 [Jatrophihabitantaceae bacterium]